MNTNDNKIVFTHAGDHHLAKAKYDPSTGKIDAGLIQSFSGNSAASVQIVDGKTIGTFIHTGDTHKTSINMNDDGTFTGSFEDTAKGLQIELEGGVASLVSGKIPINGINIIANHHIIKLKLDENNSLCGSIGSKDTQYGNFKIYLDQGKISGALCHSGGGHEECFQIFSDGTYKASISAGSQGSKLSLSIENGNAGAKAFGELSFKF